MHGNRRLEAIEMCYRYGGKGVGVVGGPHKLLAAKFMFLDLRLCRLGISPNKS